MRRKRRKNSSYTFDRRLLFGAVISLAFILATTNFNFGDSAVPDMITSSVIENGTAEVVGLALEEPQTEPQPEGSAFLSEELWADVSEEISTPRPTHTPPDRISLNVKDANLLDVLSMLAYKLDANVIFLEEPSQITIKTSVLSPITTFQIVLQKSGLDYLVIGRNYIVGNRDRLYGDFTNRMFLTRYNLFYVSADNMMDYIEELGMPLQSLAVDSNQKALWMQGTPMALGKARELINALDVMENAVFAEGGARKIRMPVANATGPRAEEELEALIDLLSILLDGFRDGRTDMGWVNWDHPDPVPRIYMEWENPIIKPYDIKMKITRDFANDYNSQIRYLIAEGNSDNIELVNQMIAAIAGTPSTPISLTEALEPDPEPEPEPVTGSVQWVPPASQGGNVQSYTVTLSAVPTEAGSLSGDGSYARGSSVTVTASSADGYEFVRWIDGGAEVSTNSSYSFSIYSNRKLEAVFTGTAGNDDTASDNEEPVTEEEQD